MLMTMLLAATLASPERATADKATFITAVRGRDVAAVTSMLEADPSLANARTDKDLSVTIVALFTNVGEGFADPKDNATLQAILARKPKFDLPETAALGTADELAALLDKDAGNAKRFYLYGWTPLHIAAFAGNVETTALLINRGADVNARAKTKFLNTPLQTALLTGQYGTAKLLLEHGADALTRQAGGFTAMHEAALMGREDLVNLLVEHGAELTSRADNGHTPVDEAIRGKHEKLAEALRTKVAALPANREGN
jgi:ankyrin repeat protein